MEINTVESRLSGSDLDSIRETLYSITYVNPNLKSIFTYIKLKNFIYFYNQEQLHE